MPYRDCPNCQKPMEIGRSCSNCGWREESSKVGRWLKLFFLAIGFLLFASVGTCSLISSRDPAGGEVWGPVAMCGGLGASFLAILCGVGLWRSLR